MQLDAEKCRLILNLTWNEIDLKSRFIWLGGLSTKKPGRVIPLNQRIVDYLKSLPRPIHAGLIIERRCWNSKAFLKALSLKGIENFIFHDLRRDAINNLRLEGNDNYVIKQASVQKQTVLSSAIWEN